MIARLVIFGQTNEAKIINILANKRGQEHFCTIIISSTTANPTCFLVAQTEYIYIYTHIHTISTHKGVMQCCFTDVGTRSVRE